MRYRHPDGRPFVLVAHEPREWGLELAARMVWLGCSEEYARAVAASYEEATPDTSPVLR